MWFDQFTYKLYFSDTHFLQGVAQTQDLLQAVWHQNYHGFSDYIHDETSMNPHHLLHSSNFHQLTDNRTNSLWNYHQKLMHDSLHTFGIPQNRKAMLPLSTRQIMEEKYGASDRLNIDQLKMASHPNFDAVGFPALLPEQNVISRMPPPFPHSFGNFNNLLERHPIFTLFFVATNFQFCFVLDDDDNDEFEEGDDLDPSHISGSPPALPPKRNLRKPPAFIPPSNQQNISSSGGDRFIPIVKESDGSIVICNRAPERDTTTQPILPPRQGSNTDRPVESTSRFSEGASEVEANEQSAASSSASCTTTTSGLGTSTTGDQSYMASDDAITHNR